MKKMTVLKVEQIEGGGRCENTAETILGLGLAFLAVPTPLTWAMGIVVTGVGSLGAYGCPW